MKRDPILPYVVETTYRVRFHEAPGNKSDDFVAFCDAVFKLERCKMYQDISVDSTSGGPAWNGYWIIECDNLKTLRLFCNRFITIARQKRVKLEEQ